MRSTIPLLLIFLMTAVTACDRKETASSTTPPVVAENSPAPNIQVTPLKGPSVSLASLKGKVVVLNFWATWCPPCRGEIPSMMRLNAAMIGKPYQMLAVSIDEGGVPAIEAFFKNSGNNLPAYSDPDGKAAKIYGITGVPETFIIDKQGVLVKKVIGALAWDSPDVASYLDGLMK